MFLTSLFKIINLKGYPWMHLHFAVLVKGEKSPAFPNQQIRFCRGWPVQKRTISFLTKNLSSFKHAWCKLKPTEVLPKCKDQWYKQFAVGLSLIAKVNNNPIARRLWKLDSCLIKKTQTQLVPHTANNLTRHCNNLTVKCTQNAGSKASFLWGDGR